MLKRRYDKIVIGCCLLFVFVNVGLASTAFSVHQPFIVAMEGVGDTGGSLILSVRTLVSLLAMTVVDRYYRALDVRIGVSLACLFTCGGFMVYSAAAGLPAAGLPVFFGGAVLLGLGYGLGGMVAMTYLANRWFTSGVGHVVGTASMGSGLASIVMPLVVVRVIEASSLSAAFMVEGALSAIIGICVFAVLRNRPSDLGLEPYERTSPNKRVPRRAPAGQTAIGRGWRIATLLAMVGVGVFSCCGITYLSVLATSSGFDALFAATLVSVAGISLTACKFLTGELFDRLGASRGSAIMFALGFAGFALCCLAETHSMTVMVAGAVLVGAGLSLGSVGVSVWSIDLSDAANRTSQIKNFQVAYSLGGFIANTLPGIVKDLVGTYVVSYAGGCVVIALAAFVILSVYRRR